MLFGKVAPTGKLPVSWPASATQQPINAGDGQTPLFPLGAGLTWSTDGGRRDRAGRTDRAWP